MHASASLPLIKKVRVKYEILVQNRLSADSEESAGQQVRVLINSLSLSRSSILLTIAARSAFQPSLAEPVTPTV